MDIKAIDIKDIDLSVRSSNALKRAGVLTVGDLLGHTEESLSKIHNLGKKSIEEILLKIEEYKTYESEGGFPNLAEESVEDLPGMPEDYSAWMQTDEGKDFILSWLKEKDVKISSLELLSTRAYNCLLINGYTQMHKIAFLTSEDLMKIPRMNSRCSEEIVRRCQHYLEEEKNDILASLKEKYKNLEENRDDSLRNMLHNNAYFEKIYHYVQENDVETKFLDLSNRTKNTLKRQGYLKLSDFIYITEEDLCRIPKLGTRCASELFACIDDYLAKNEIRIKAYLNGDDSVLWDKKIIAEKINIEFNRIGFGGYSLQELRSKAQIPEQFPEEEIKKILGSMIADGTLEYVDYRCYRVYPKFEEYLTLCSDISDRNRQIIMQKLAGDTLESIGFNQGVSKERVRQIISSDIRKVKKYYYSKSGLEWFDEDYYRYFFETYAFDKKDAEQWLGLSKKIFNYLEMTGSKQGTKSLEEAQDDYHNLDLGFRLRIKNYLNRNKLFLDGRWIEKNRAELEEYVIRKYCTNTVFFNEFTQIYNDFLREEEIQPNENLYYTEEHERALKRRLPEAKFLLWTYGEKIRYYDIEGHDYTELWDAINLDAYENIEYSAKKFMDEYPEIMEKYDIRDHYELHNLLRKTVPAGSYHDFHCKRTPMIEFGKFDRDSALLDILIDNAPISQTDFAELVSQEYGYDPATVIGSYVQPLGAYYHQGMYVIEQKAMLLENQKILLDHLDDDFYYIDEIRKIYSSLFPDADIEEINPYNLKTMGFSMLSRYVYRNHNSLESYFRYLLTKEDVTDITPYRRRFAYVVSFSNTFVNMKNELEIFEFEPNQIITYRKIDAAGITKDDLQVFCDEAADFVENGTYFSIKDIKKDGFESGLFDLGFSDWFYACLLTADDRFSYTKAFGNIILYKGDESITIQSFAVHLIKEHESIDVYDLMTEMEETYGCRVPDRLDIIYKVKETDVFYDEFLDRLYANTSIFNRELDETEGM